MSILDIDIDFTSNLTAVTCDIMRQHLAFVEVVLSDILADSAEQGDKSGPVS